VKFTSQEEKDPAGKIVGYEFLTFPDAFGPDIDEQLRWCEENWKGVPGVDWEFSLQEMFAREYAVERGGGVTPITDLQSIHWMFSIRTRNDEDAMVFKLKFC
jgi:hypothetical protein